MSTDNHFFLGIDVQVARDCPYAVFNDQLNLLKSGWLESVDTGNIGKTLFVQVRLIEKELGGDLAIGIDSPRVPLTSPRRFRWNRGRQNWERRQNGAGYGRHCEVIIRTLKLANPQWTPIQGRCPDWMMLGFELFSSIEERSDVFEVFPSASYTMLDNCSEPKFQVNLSGFSRGPKDMLDACVAAVTVREFFAGRGCKVWDGDGLGSIILPRSLPHSVPPLLLAWPSG
ncbi:hypothetical protein KA005_83060 [bacterium]|nr:hypothetical protein [bacterium]